MMLFLIIFSYITVTDRQWFFTTVGPQQIQKLESRFAEDLHIKQRADIIGFFNFPKKEGACVCPFHSDIHDHGLFLDILFRPV